MATRTLPSLVVPCVLVAASALVSARAEAQAPPGEVQPVPYTQSQPVPYGTPSEPHPPTEAGPDAAPVESQPQVGGDAVTLREGEVIRGVLVESLPNDHATVQLPNGQLALIPWERIARIDRAPVRGASAPGVAPEVCADDVTARSATPSNPTSGPVLTSTIPPASPATAARFTSMTIRSPGRASSWNGALARVPRPVMR